MIKVVYFLVVKLICYLKYIVHVINCKSMEVVSWVARSCYKSMSVVKMDVNHRWFKHA